MAPLVSIRQMSRQVSRGSAGEYQEDERAGVARLSWRVQQKRHRCKEQTFRLCGRRRGWVDERIALKHVYYHMWNRLPVQVRCMRQGAQGWCTGMTLRDGWGGRREGGSGWGTHVHPWLIHVNVWQKPLQYCKVISLQLKSINQFLKNK